MPGPARLRFFAALPPKSPLATRPNPLPCRTLPATPSFHSAIKEFSANVLKIITFAGGRGPVALCLTWHLTIACCPSNPSFIPEN